MWRTSAAERAKTVRSFRPSELKSLLALSRAYPELRWFSETIYPSKPEGAEGSPSAEIFDTEVAEFDRAVSRIHLLTRSLSKSGKSDPWPGQQIPEHFLDLVTNLASKVIGDSDDKLDEMVVGLVLADLGFTRNFLQIAERCAERRGNLFQWMLQTLREAPASFPSFARLPGAAQERTLAGIQAEWNSETLPARWSSVGPDADRDFLLLHLLLVTGGGGYAGGNPDATRAWGDRQTFNMVAQLYLTGLCLYGENHFPGFSFWRDYDGGMTCRWTRRS